MVFGLGHLFGSYELILSSVNDEAVSFLVLKGGEECGTLFISKSSRRMTYHIGKGRYFGKGSIDLKEVNFVYHKGRVSIQIQGSRTLVFKCSEEVYGVLDSVFV
ncbi:hypothetical protein ACF8C4_08370 [Myroides odoratimimus]|uniref:hypothetical protein n=1 Tax=Myroides odoratimimus TaxID=76832 RepID=UPI00217FE48D|nr:hypothetical protein [Myroides odoratimimus]MCS7472834.1 hypothetical protein [Myroides odoratimimus]MDM1508489.1 hypothetical protein [Myroides odoratimimus]MDM1518903.1 hypothetical protein [Myroides odoratimimus]MDM1525064.1 hypothetical protein [Myroides odoratimimus]MDM1678581.1 hypothetical protein [Myroides odoratimimus]